MSNQIRNNGYYHSMPGRIRVRVTNLKNRTESAKSLEVLMMSEPGVKHVRASALTGNVLVVFDERMTYDRAVLASLAALGHRPLTCEREEDCAEAEAICDLGVHIGKQLAVAALKRALTGTPALLLLELL